MSFEVRITGPDPSRLARRIQGAVKAGLGPEIAAGLAQVSKPFQSSIAAEAVATMPSGYGPVLGPSVRVRATTRASASDGEVTLRVSAAARGGRRHLVAVNRGRLRHPLYGNRNFWYAQAVKAGVVDRPAERLRPQARKQMERVVRDVAKRMGAQ